jgi:two-component system invasion response regulator UvrY
LPRWGVGATLDLMSGDRHRPGEGSTRGAEVGVVTVDDQPVFLKAARDVIRATPGFASVGQACSGEEALAVVDEQRPELVLVDLRMPGMDGIEVARSIKATHPEVIVVLISLEEPENAPDAASSSGAAALVCKQDFGPRLLRRLWLAHAPRR